MTLQLPFNHESHATKRGSADYLYLRECLPSVGLPAVALCTPATSMIPIVTFLWQYNCTHNK